MRQPHFHHRLPVATHQRAGLRASVLVLLAMFSILLPQWQGLVPAAAALATDTHANGEEAPAHELAEEQAPAKLRRVAPLQASRAAASRPAPMMLPLARVQRLVPVALSTMPATPVARPPATIPRWRLRRSQAPPLV